MKTTSRAEDKEETKEEPTTGFRASPWRHLVSVFILVHLAAVVTSPFSFSTRSIDSISPVAEKMYGGLGRYIDVAFLDHGYAFFAPDPGESYLVRAYIPQADGEELVVMYPDKHRQRPRLYYHRHFMMTESLNASWVSAEPPLEPEEGVTNRSEVMQEYAANYKLWKEARERYDLQWKAIENHLKAEYDVESVRIERVVHYLPRPIDVLDRGSSEKDEFYDAFYFPISEVDNLPIIDDAELDQEEVTDASQRKPNPNPNAEVLPTVSGEQP